MRAAPDEEFKLRFPVAKDRTLRRIAIAQLTIYLAAILAVPVMLVNSFFIEGLEENPGGAHLSISNAADAIALIAAFIFVAAFPASWIVAIIQARVQGRRAVSEPIEAGDGVEALLWRMRQASSDAEQAEYMALVGTDRAAQGPLPLPPPLRPQPRRAR